MNPATASFQPVARSEHLDRLEIVLSKPDLPPELWAMVDAEIQQRLATLDAEVQRKLAGVQVAAGSTKGKNFLLCSYRTFSVSQSNVDPVVAAITFTATPLGVAVEADVSGEQTGDIICTSSSKTAAALSKDILEAARACVNDLAGRAALIIAALQDAARSIE